MKTQRTCFALNLKEMNIAQYEHYHQPGNIWTEISQGIRDSGILDMQIYRIGNHLFMIVEMPERLLIEEAFGEIDKMPQQAEWSTLMKGFQERLKEAQLDEHWAKMKLVFSLNGCLK